MQVEQVSQLAAYSVHWSVGVGNVPSYLGELQRLTEIPLCKYLQVEQRLASLCFEGTDHCQLPLCVCSVTEHLVVGALTVLVGELVRVFVYAGVCDSISVDVAPLG
jgi:hypothetical protein